ncbi:MAG: sugar phosphate isomerase/epimerase family protein [Spirochaetia bacterium]
MINVTDYCIFSKHLHSLEIGEAAETAADAGFSGIDLTVRPGGHVDTGSGNSLESDLARAVEKINAAGLTCPMMVTSITGADDPGAEQVLRAAADQEITRYRMGYLKYDYTSGMEENLDTFRRKMEQLCRLNEKTGVRGSYQNHGGNWLGSAVWDLWYTLKDLDPAWIGCQYDVKHAVMEGGKSWINGLRILLPWIGDADIKDGLWRPGENGGFIPDSVPLGEGMVDWKSWRGLLNEGGFSGPLSLHFEFPLDPDNPEEPGSPEWKKQMTQVMRRELGKCRSFAEGKS